MKIRFYFILLLSLTIAFSSITACSDEKSPPITQTGEDNVKSYSVRLRHIIVLDRNVGAQQDGVALNYTNDSSHADHNNSDFKGNYYTWEEALSACPAGWRLPTVDEMIIIDTALKFSDGRAYIKDGEGKMCYFPLSGDESNSSSVYGRYWCSKERDDNHAFCLSLNIKSNNVSSYVVKSDGYSVRCVKTVDQLF